MTDRQTTLSDKVGQTIEILGRTFTVDWIDAPKSEDNGKIMVQSADTEIYHIGDRDEPLAEVESEISHGLSKATCVITLDEQITRYARRIAAQVCGGPVDNNTVGGLVDALIIQEACSPRPLRTGRSSGREISIQACMERRWLNDHGTNTQSKTNVWPIYFAEPQDQQFAC